MAAVSALAERLAIVSAERIRDEFSKLMVGDHVSGCFVGTNADRSLPDQFLPELSLLRMEQDPVQRHKDVLAHTIAVVDEDRTHGSLSVWPLCCTTSANRQPASSAHEESRSITMRWWGRA